MTSGSAVLYSPSAELHYFACKVKHVISIETLAIERERYLLDYAHRQVDLVSCLASDCRFTYDMRFISRPPSGETRRGFLEVALLCRAEVSKSDAMRHAYDTLHLLGATSEEHCFELASEREVCELLAPFPLTSGFAITRRCSWEVLDTIRSGIASEAHVGFSNAEVSDCLEQDESKIFHVSPFLWTPPSSNLLRFLLLQRNQVMLSIRIRKIQLSEGDERLLERQIAKCERYSQINISSIADDLSSLAPTLREQAKMYQQYQCELLFGLRNRAVVMTIEVAGSEPLSDLVAGVVGASVTEPTGGSSARKDRSLFAFLAGGYSVARLNHESIEAIARMEISFPTPETSLLDGRRLLHLFDSVECAHAFRLPPATTDPNCGISIRNWREHSPAHDLLKTGLFLGNTTQGGTTCDVRLGDEDRLRHIYTVGQTGTGKTTLLKTLILDDIQSGRGLCVLDPHGDLYRELLGRIPENRVDDVVLIDPTDVSWPVGINPLEYESESQRHFLVQEMASIISRMIKDDFGTNAVGEMAGPVFYQHMRMNLLLVMSRPNDPGTLLEFHRLFQDRSYWKKFTPLGLDDPQLDHWVKEILSQTDYVRSTPSNCSMGEYLASKFDNFVFDPMIRNIFGQKRSTVDLRKVMDEGKILLVNLAKGELTEPNSRFLGMLLLAKIQAAALSRVNIPSGERRPFYLYVDEFQSLATRNFVTLLSEGRKFGVSLVLANQFISQIEDPHISEAIFGNVGTVVAFRLGQADAGIIEREMSPVVGCTELVNLPNWRAYASLLVNGQAVQPFTLRTLPPTGESRPDVAERVIDASRRKYSRPRSDVERSITESLSGVQEAEATIS